MRKLITLSDPQNQLAERLMRETYQTSLAGLLVLLMVQYEQTITGKRGPGRPRSQGNGTDETEDSTVARYQSPDYPDTKSPYTKDEVDGWYDFRNLPVPKDAYKVHPKYKIGD